MSYLPAAGITLDHNSSLPLSEVKSVILYTNNKKKKGFKKNINILAGYQLTEDRITSFTAGGAHTKSAVVLGNDNFTFSHL